MHVGLGLNHRPSGDIHNRWQEWRHKIRKTMGRCHWRGLDFLPTQIRWVAKTRQKGQSQSVTRCLDQPMF